MENALSKFDKHEKSHCHRVAASHEITVWQCADIAEILNAKKIEVRKLDRRCFLIVLETV